MRWLRSPGSVGLWAVVLGLLLAVVPLLQTPCSRVVGPQPTAPDAAVMGTTTGAQWACSEAASALSVRSVPDRTDASLDLVPDDGSSESTASQLPAVAFHSPPRAPRLPVVPTLDRLRPVVLQI